MRFREHRGSLNESLKTVVTLKNRAALVRYCQRLLRSFCFQFAASALHISKYDLCHDKRADWNRTYIVTIDGYGVMGFTDSPN